MNARPRTPGFLSILALLCLAACAGGRRPAPQAPDTIDAGEGNRDWYAGTDAMRERLRVLILELEDADEAERLEIGRRIVAMGEPAVPQLVAALSAPSPGTRSAAAWLLGFMGDPRTSGALVGAVDDPVGHVRYEAAASLLKMKDPRGLPVLVDGLEDPDALVRAKCIILLEEMTGEDLGYRPDLAPDERRAAAARWRAWALERQGTPP